MGENMNMYLYNVTLLTGSLSLVSTVAGLSLFLMKSWRNAAWWLLVSSTLLWITFIIRDFFVILK